MVFYHNCYVTIQKITMLFQPITDLLKVVVFYRINLLGQQSL